MRRLPFVLMDKVDKKLDDLLDKGITEEVPNSFTAWVSPLVVAKAGRGHTSMRKHERANKEIVRERNPIPTFDEVLYDLNGSTVFSKLNFKWGFHQVELEEESGEITTFVTHRGLYRYKRLMFGISYAPEKYWKIVSDVLQWSSEHCGLSDCLWNRPGRAS